LWQSFVAARREACDLEGPYANRLFAIPPTPKEDRRGRFVDLMALQGFEMHATESALKAPLAVDQLGRQLTDLQLPEGTLLLSNRQPLGHLLAAMLEFDPRFSQDVLQDERKEVLAHGRSKIYDTTAWNLTMMYGLKAYLLPMKLPPTAAAYSPSNLTTTSSEPSDRRDVAVIIDGTDDRSLSVAVRLMQQGLEVRVSRRSFAFEKQSFARGSLVVSELDQRGRRPDWRVAAHRLAASMGLKAVAVSTGLGPGELPDLGGRYFVRLEPPRVAMVMRGRSDRYDYGSIWHLLDHRLELAHSQLNLDLPSSLADLSRYNVLILPGGWSGENVADRMPRVEDWVKSGGTLIAIGSGTNPFTEEESELSQVRRLEHVLDQLDEYELAIWREWMANEKVLPEPSSIWTNRVPAEATLPWNMYGGPRPELEELERRDAWQRLFMPAGALVAGRFSPEHWLTLGCEAPLPLLIRRCPILMSKPGVETAVRLGYLVSNESPISPSVENDLTEGDEKPRDGWAATPGNGDLYLRMSGLLWPEATHRLAHAAYLTRESVGDGQVILFADSPNFRASTLGTARLLMNAIVYGPGFGARQPIRP
jgi:hypothetical protein